MSKSKMVGFSLLICCFFAILQNGNSDPLNFRNKFFGGCPDVKSRSLLNKENMDGEWFTHWVTNDYSPWKYFQCQSNVFESTLSNDASKITTKFTLPPYFPVPVTMEAKQLTKKQNEYSYSYDNAVFGNFPQKTAILEKLTSGETLIWTCSDFKFFHLENFQVMTKYRDSPAGSKMNEYALRNLGYAMRNYGLLADFFVKVDQTC